MMYSHNLEVLKLMAEERIQRRLRQAMIHRQLRVAGPMKPSWFSKRASLLLSAFGRTLVRRGQYLERLGASQEAFLSQPDPLFETANSE